MLLLDALRGDLKKAVKKVTVFEGFLITSLR